MINKIAAALRDAQRETGIRMPGDAIFITGNPDFEEVFRERVCGLDVVYIPTSSDTLGRVPWALARAFEDALSKQKDAR